MLDGRICTMDLEAGRGCGGADAGVDGCVECAGATGGFHKLHSVAPQREIGSHESGVVAMCYNECCGYLCSVGYETEAYCWVPSVTGYRNALVHEISTDKAPFVNIHSVPDTPQVITADVKGTVKIWDLRTFRCVQSFPVGWTPEESVEVPQLEGGRAGGGRVSSTCYVDSLGTFLAQGWRTLYVHK
eukprot:gene8550-13760_t